MAKFLAAQEIFLAPDQNLLAGGHMVDMAVTRYSGKGMVMLCGRNLRQYALSIGLLLDDNNPELVLIGRDTDLSYKRQKDATNPLEDGVPLLVANPNLTHPGKNNLIKPKTGALLSAVQARVLAFLTGHPTGSSHLKMIQKRIRRAIKAACARFFTPRTLKILLT